MPCYSQRNVDTQRGNKVFERSIDGLRKLNALGYGIPGSGLHLDLVYNPGGAFLPPAQEMLQAKYTEELSSAFDVRFNELFTMVRTARPSQPFHGFSTVLPQPSTMVRIDAELEHWRVFVILLRRALTV